MPQIRRRRILIILGLSFIALAPVLWVILNNVFLAAVALGVGISTIAITITIKFPLIKKIGRAYIPFLLIPFKRGCIVCYPKILLPKSRHNTVFKYINFVFPFVNIQKALNMSEKLPRKASSITDENMCIQTLYSLARALGFRERKIISLFALQRDNEILNLLCTLLKVSSEGKSRAIYFLNNSGELIVKAKEL